MPLSSHQCFDLFLFDPLEGLPDIENTLVSLASAYPWVKSASAVDRAPGWLRRGLEANPPATWSYEFLCTLLQLGGEHREPEFLREFLSQAAQLGSLLEPQPWHAMWFDALLDRLDLLDDEINRGWVLSTLANAAARLGVQSWSPTLFLELLRLTRMLRAEDEKARLAGHLADALGRLCQAPWCPDLFESLVGLVKGLRSEALRQEAILAVSEQFFGYERLRPELADVRRCKSLALLSLSVGVTNNPDYRKAFAGRVRFMASQLQGRFDVIPDAWEELLTTCEGLQPWRHDEFDLQGELRWSLQPLSVLLGLLGRDIRSASNRGWSHRFFERLCDQIFLLAPGNAREQSIRDVIHGLIQHFAEDEEETMAWLQRLLQQADRVEREPSQIYDGVFQGFLSKGDLHRANAAALRIIHPALRDQAFAQMASAWKRHQQPQQALVSLYEISDAALRGDIALELAGDASVVQDPLACTMLFQAAASLPAAAQEVLRTVVAHPAFPAEAREAILDEAPEAPLSYFARCEQLVALERVREHLPIAVYTQERQRLMGLAQALSWDAPTQIAVNVPHAYGDGLFLTPSDHIQRNHFGAEVAGSQISAWDDFAHMWLEIQPEVEARLDVAGGVQVFELGLPIDVGTTGVMLLEDAPVSHLSTEIRNGQPSLYCLAPEVRQPARSLTIVIGPSAVGPDEIDDYPGHSLAHVLYTIYPGQPAYPFPRCSQSLYPKLETSLQAVLSLLASGQQEEARALLFETYSRLEGSEESARYWSRHVLIH